MSFNIPKPKVLRPNRLKVVFPAKSLKPWVLGDLPVGALEQFGILLTAGKVAFSIAAQQHALRAHPAEFADCKPMLEKTVQTPTHVGQGPGYEGIGFELIYDDTNRIVLLGVSMIKGRGGMYAATSTYLIDRNKLERRMKKGHIIRFEV